MGEGGVGGWRGGRCGGRGRGGEVGKGGTVGEGGGFKGKLKNNSQIGYKEGDRYRRWRETCKSRTGRSLEETGCDRGGGIVKKIKQEGRKKNDTWGRRRFDSPGNYRDKWNTTKFSARNAQVRGSQGPRRF